MLIASNIYVRRKSYKVDRAPTITHVINSSLVSTARFCSLLIQRARRDRKRGRNLEKSWTEAHGEWRRDRTLLIFAGIEVGRSLAFISHRMNRARRSFLHEISLTRNALKFRVFRKNLALYIVAIVHTASRKYQAGVILTNLKVRYYIRIPKMLKFFFFLFPLYHFLHIFCPLKLIQNLSSLSDEFYGTEDFFNHVARA